MYLVNIKEFNMYTILKTIIMISIVIISLNSCGAEGSSTNYFEGSTKVDNFTISDFLPTTLAAGEKSTYQIEVSPEDATVIYALEDAPSWLTINSNGFLTATPSVDDNGTYTFSLSAKNTTISKKIDITLNVKQINTTLVSDMDNAPLLQVESVIEPIKSTNFNAVKKVQNSDGSWDVLAIYFKEYGGDNEIVIIDTGTNEIKHEYQPPYMQWHLAGSVIAPNGKLYILTVVRPGLSLAINIYDPETNTLALNAITIPTTFFGELHPMVLGTDNNIYIAANGNDNQLRVLSINPDTKALHDYGTIGETYPPEVGFKGSAVCSDADYIYTVSQYNPYYLASKNKTTGAKKTLQESSNVIYLTQTEFGCTAAANGVHYYLHEGNKLTESEFSYDLWNIPLNRQNDPDLFTSKQNIQTHKEPTVITNNAQVSVNEDAELWIDVDGVLKPYTYSLKTYPYTISRLYTLDNGNLFGTGDASSGHFIYDTHTNSLKKLGKAPVSHATSTQLGNKLYMSGYPSATTLEYDLTKPWTQLQNSWFPGSVDVNPNTLNPRFLGHFRWDAEGNRVSGTHKALASAVGADGQVYIGGEWYRDGRGGGLNWYNPSTQIYDGMYDIFSNYAITDMTTTSNGKYIILSTMGVIDTVLGKSTPTQGRIFVFNTQTKKIVRFIDPLPQAISSGQIIGTDGPYIVGIGTNASRDTTYIYRLNTETGIFDYRKEFNFTSVYSNTGIYGGGKLIAKGPHSKIWTFMGGKLVKIDPFTAEITVIARLSKDGVENTSGQYGGLVFSGNDLYLSAEVFLRRLVDIAN